MIDLKKKKKKKGRKRTNKMRNAKRTFRCLYNDQGVKIVDKQQVKDMVIEFYQRLLGSCF